MKRESIFTIWLAVAIGSLISLAAHGDQLIPRSMSGDKGKYYLVESEKVGDIVSALHKRVGPSGTGYTRTETNCKTMQMREIGYGDDSIENIIIRPTKWFVLMPGSSKSDLARFVCHQRRTHAVEKEQERLKRKVTPEESEQELQQRAEAYAREQKRIQEQYDPDSIPCLTCPE